MNPGRYEYLLDPTEQTAKGSVVRLVGQRKTVLEIGCATGAMTRCLSDRLGCTVTGLEVNAVDAELARPYCESLHVASIEDADLHSLLDHKSFEVIVFADVLEHLRDPIASLRKSRLILAESGYIVASIPNIAHAAIAFELALGRFDYRKTGLLDDTHIHFFTKKSILRTFEAAGYAVVHLERMVVEPRFTEFATEPQTDLERDLLKQLLDLHPESTTYQFVVKAVPVDRELSGVASATSELEASVSALQVQLAQERIKRQRAESKLAWLSNRWPARWLARLPGRSGA